MNFINIALENLNRTLSIYLLIPILIIAGIYFSIRTRFVQIRYFKDAFRSLFEKSEEGKISSFQSIMISTASKIGVGHIAGITFAIVIGGPGAVFWMWIMAVLGSCSGFIECTLAQIYKKKDPEHGGFVGGPSYYITKCLNNRFLAVLFSCLLIGGYAYGFNSLQSYQLSSAFEYYIKDYHSSIFPLIVGIVLALTIALVIFGGTHRIAFVTTYIVPVMSISYMLLAFIIIFKNLDKIPSVFSTIIKEAFDFRAMLAAPFYVSALLNGIKKGLFSNEAGMGSTPNAAAKADVAHPVTQGLAQVFSVFIDTILICSATAMIVLLSGVKLDKSISQILLVQNAAMSQIGIVGVHLVFFAIVFFAFASMIGNYCYAESNFTFLNKRKNSLIIFRITCILAVFLGAQAEVNTVWNFAEIFMSFMAIINICVILLIGNIAIKALKDYSKKRSEKEKITFKESDIGITNTDVWK